MKSRAKLQKDEELETISSFLPTYQDFLKTIGFKRTDGAIYGLLVLHPGPLSAQEIEEILGLSQGAVSLGIKSLIHWGAVESRYDSQRRVHLHQAVTDSLSIVATVFQKREKGAIGDFRRVAELAKHRFLGEGDSEDDPRIQRLGSIVLTCEFAQIIMKFVIYLNSLQLKGQYRTFLKALPKALDVSVKGLRVTHRLRTQLKNFREQSTWL